MKVSGSVVCWRPCPHSSPLLSTHSPLPHSVFLSSSFLYFLFLRFALHATHFPASLHCSRQLIGYPPHATSAFTAWTLRPSTDPPFLSERDAFYVLLDAVVID